MLEIGKFCELEIIKKDEKGLFLDGLNLGEVLLPKREVPEIYEIGEKMRVFTYKDSQSNIMATLKIPHGQLDEFAFLKVVDIAKIGAFLEWGLDKQLFLPFPEQEKRVELNQWYVVKILLDNEDRLIASTIVDDFVDNEELKVTEGEEVDIIVYRITDLGYLSIVNNEHFGIIYKNEVFNTLNVGQKLKAFIKKVRKDNKLDLSVSNQSVKRFDEFTELVFNKLKEDGELNITDKSSPELIYAEFNMSKKNFKKAVGALYKKRLIKIEKDKIILL